MVNVGKKVNVLDIRPMEEWSQWYIPDSIYFNEYDKLKAKESNTLERLHIDKSVPIIPVCAAGKTSKIAAEILHENGFEAYSLKEGMEGWGLACNTAKISLPGFNIIQTRRTCEGCLSYIISSSGEAIIVDALFQPGIFEQILAEENLVLR